MATRLQRDLAVLSGLAYHRLEWHGEAVRRYYRLRAQKRRGLQDVEKVYRWLLVPLTLWPLNLHDVFCACLDQIEADGKIDEAMRLLIAVLSEPPDAALCELVAEHEREVQGGRYETMVKTAAKFEGVEEKVRREPQLHRQWEEIKAQFAVDRFRDGKGVLRRTLGAERNLRMPFDVKWDDVRGRFQAVFDAFCLRWNLYGMQHDEPLIMKLSVNLTPHGTMIFIPSYWSFDAKRDVSWGAVTQLHKARAKERQGAALKDGWDERRRQAEKLWKLDAEADAKGFKGDKRHAFLCAGLGWVEGTSPKRLQRLRKEFP